MFRRSVKAHLNKKRIIKTLNDIIKLNWELLRDEEDESEIFKALVHAKEDTDNIIKTQLKKIIDLQDNQLSRLMMQQWICAKKLEELKHTKSGQTQTDFDEKIPCVEAGVDHRKGKTFTLKRNGEV